MTGEVVATVSRNDPGDALREYLHRWMLECNEGVGAPDLSSVGASWTPETPDDFVSVIPSVSMTDCKTVAAWSATIHDLGPVSKDHAAHRADFMFWKGNPFSSAGTGAVPLSSSATYDLSWDGRRHAWAITQTSESPDSHLVEPSQEDPASP